jgi:hypothetical protein
MKGFCASAENSLESEVKERRELLKFCFLASKDGVPLQECRAA